MPMSRYIVLAGCEVLLGLLTLVSAAVQLAEAQVAVGEQLPEEPPDFGLDMPPQSRGSTR